MIPFLVVDRPISLRIIKGSSLSGTIGLMSHANATPLFKKLFKNYPCEEGICHIINQNSEKFCPYPYDSSQCEKATRLIQNTIKICDCGMFTKEGTKFSYKDLYNIYEEMGADYGIMMDVFGDSDATLESAKNALKIYKEKDYAFKLILVAQGTTVEEYIKSYEDLLNLGGEFIAVGGLLRKRVNTARYVYVKSLSFMVDVFKSLRYEFNPSWLFALGCYHPKRHKIFDDFGVWGSDYKGWIFQYKKRERMIQQHWEIIIKQLDGIATRDHDRLISKFRSAIGQRSAILADYEKSEYKKSRRNLSIADRNPSFIKLDNKLLLMLNEIQLVLSLNGTRSIIEVEKKTIIELALASEQQIRFDQLRSLISDLVK